MKWKWKRRGFVVVVATTLWIWGWYATEWWFPPLQLSGLWNRGFGEKRFRTARETSVSSAVGTLRMYFQKRGGEIRSGSPERLPENWQELVFAASGHRQKYLRGSVSEAFPFLYENRDPWGHPWVFRLQIDEMLSLPREDSYWIDVTFGSVGPDGVECPSDRDSATGKPIHNCDDLIYHFGMSSNPGHCIPPGTPPMPQPKEPRVYKVPDGLW